ncbi:MAG: hypothetical protein QF913_09555, partial [Nitrospinaceae bacterium]|nr:hypothetical protein [Nitrospinaceae bacterium]
MIRWKNLYIAVFMLVVAPLVGTQQVSAQAGGHASVGLGHGEEGYLHLEEMVKHLEFALKMPDAGEDLKSHGGTAVQHAREALKHYNEALKHANESLGRSARAQSRLKVRQPLAEFVAEVRHDWEHFALVEIEQILKEELNVKI